MCVLDIPCPEIEEEHKEDPSYSNDPHHNHHNSGARIIACVNCRRSKVRCEGGIPCRRCVRLSIHDSCQRCTSHRGVRKRKDLPMSFFSAVGSSHMLGGGGGGGDGGGGGGGGGGGFNSTTPTTASLVSDNTTTNNNNNKRHCANLNLNPTESTTPLSYPSPANNSIFNNSSPSLSAAAAAAAINININPSISSSTTTSSSSSSPSSSTTRTPEEIEKDHIQLFASLTGHFRSWRDQLLARPEISQGELARFLWFCSYLSHSINEYVLTYQHQQPAGEAQKMVSVWLCSYLAEDINRFVSNLPSDSLAFPDVSGQVDDFSNGVEKQVFKQLPQGVCVLPLFPRPFCNGENRPWLNGRLSEILGYSREELSLMLSERSTCMRLFESTSYLAATGLMWDAIAQQKQTFTCRLSWFSKSGKPMHTMTTHWVKYRQGLPVNLVMFVQPIPEVLVSTPTVAPMMVPTYREENKMVLPSMPFVASAPATRPRSILASLTSSISNQPNKQYATLVVPSMSSLPIITTTNTASASLTSPTQYLHPQTNAMPTATTAMTANAGSFQDLSPESSSNFALSDPIIKDDPLAFSFFSHPSQIPTFSFFE